MVVFNELMWKSMYMCLQGGGRYLGARGHAGGGGYLVYFLSESTSVLLGGYLLSRTFSYKYFGT